MGITSLPYLYGWWNTPPGWTYLGVHTNFDDQAVYAGWIKQAQEGRFFFENRFTTDPQPRLTVHLYFWLLGQISALVGIPMAMHIGRVLFSVLFLFQLRKLINRFAPDEFSRNVIWAIATFGAGTGWFFWKRYGHDAPVDVWQPEAFTFPSLMTNCLFPPSLWLIVLIWNSLLDARDSWKHVLIGAVGSFLLANIHTYDVLSLGLVALGFLINQLASGRMDREWFVRGLLIVSGALPSLGWLGYVVVNDPVFAQRAETPTFSPVFTRVLGGYGLLLGLSVMAWLVHGKRMGRFWLSAVCSGLFLLILLSILVLQRNYTETEIWLGFAEWTALFLGCLFLSALHAPASPAWGLCFSWVVVGISAIYFPALFQRKLIMGLQIPLGIGAGWFLAYLLGKLPTRLRNGFAVLCVLIVGLSSWKWLDREIQMARDNISNTAVHSIYLDQDVTAILKLLQRVAKPGEVILAAPGISVQTDTMEFLLLVPDLNPVFTGWGGARTWASHWSETPMYVQRRILLWRTLFSMPLNATAILRLLSHTGADYFCVPVSPETSIVDIPAPELYQEFGVPLYQGKSFWLFRVKNNALL